MIYYGLIILSVIMFGGCFALNDFYRREMGSNLRAAIQLSAISSGCGAVILFFTNGGEFEFTLFSFILAVITSLCSVLQTYFSLLALEKINLSLFSLFTMLGGMVLPFLQGIIFYGEGLTLQKCLCFAVILVSLLATVKNENKRGGGIYYLLIFVLNGMSGVLSKIFTASDYPKTSAAGYSLLTALCCAAISCSVLLFLKKGKAQNITSLTFAASSGIINRVANFILIIALMHVDASVQYPMVTGGVIIVSTLSCYFLGQKPSKRELLSVCLAFLAMIILFI